MSDDKGLVSEDEGGGYVLTDDEVTMLRAVLRMKLEDLNRKMKYEREYSKSRREDFDDMRALYIKLGGK